jgi:hypothetical protein
MSTPSLQGNSSLSLDDATKADGKQPSAESGNCGPVNAAADLRTNKKIWTGRVLTGRILTALAGLFMIFDGVAKLFMPAQVVQASGRLGFPLGITPGVGVLLLLCTLVYLIPRSAVLGALLLTGYLGGAVAIQLRAGTPVFETVFPVLFAILVWAGVYLREDRLRAVLPLRCLRG